MMSERECEELLPDPEDLRLSHAGRHRLDTFIQERDGDPATWADKLRVAVHDLLMWATIAIFVVAVIFLFATFYQMAKLLMGTVSADIVLGYVVTVAIGFALVLVLPCLASWIGDDWWYAEGDA